MVVTAGDLSLTMNQLGYDEIMLIATNKLRSEALLRYFREDEEENAVQ